MITFLNRCNTAAGSGHPLSSLWGNAKKKRSKRIPVRNYKADEELVAEALISLSQSTSDASTAGDHPTKSSTDHHEIILYNPAVHKISFFVSGQTLHGRPASDNRNLVTLTSSRKLYKCDVCGECFETGQRLGGHKRKHFTGVILRKVSGGRKKGINSISGVSAIGGASSDGGSGEVAPTTPRRGLNLDLNLPPPPEDCRLNLVLNLSPSPED